MKNPKLMLRSPLRKKPSRQPGFQRLPVVQGETQEIRREGNQNQAAG